MRLTPTAELVFQPVGYTEGFGYFQSSDALFRDLARYTAVPGQQRKCEYGQALTGGYRRLGKRLSNSACPATF